MRLITPTERSFLAQNFNIHHKFWVKDVDNAWKELTNLGGVNWFVSAEWGSTIDQPMVAGTITLRRETSAGSIAPLMLGSLFNRNALGNYAPLIAEGRTIQLSTAVTPVGGSPVTGDWREMFNGKIDRIKSTPDGHLVLEFRDALARLADVWIEDPTIYSTPAGTPAEAVIQALINDWYPTPFTIYTPISPGYLIHQYQQQPMTLLDAILEIARLPGYDFRYRWNSELAGDETAAKFRYTFYNSHAVKGTPDTEFGSGEYLDVSDLETSDADIRNAARGYYFDSGGNLQSLLREDAGSIAAFGRHFIQFAETVDSPINTAVEMFDFLGFVLNDLAAPPAVQEIETLYFWPIQLGDLYRFLPNGIHYDEAHDWYVTGWRHRIGVDGPGTGRTVISTRGTIAGAFGRWLRQAGTPPDEALITGPTLEVTTVSGITEYQVIWAGIGSIELSTDGGAHWAAPPASPITVPRPIPGAANLEYAFRATRNGQTISNTVSIPALGITTATPNLSVAPGTITATSIVLQPVASNPHTSVTPALTLTYVNCTGNVPAGSITSGTLVSVNRPVFASAPAFVRFRASITGGGFEEITIPVPNQDKTTFGPSLTVTPTPAPTQYSIAWVAGAGTIVTLSIDGAADAAPGASPIVVARNASGGPDKIYRFKAVADGQTITQTVIIPAQAPPPPPVLPPSIDAFWTTNGTAGVAIRLNWTVSNAPAGHTFDLIHQDSAEAGGVGSQTIAGVTNPHDFTVFIPVAKGTGGAIPTEISFELRMKSSGGVVIATKNTSRFVYVAP